MISCPTRLSQSVLINYDRKIVHIYGSKIEKYLSTKNMYKLLLFNCI